MIPIDPDGRLFEDLTQEQIAQAQSVARPLWPGVPPEARGNSAADIPILYPYLPDEDKRTGRAVLVLPGGGYRYHASHEGIPVAEWLVSLGIAAFVLTYRLRPYVFPVPLLDAKRAVRAIRAGADGFNIDPARIGVIGFSAGGHLTSAVATLFDLGDPDSPDPVERVSCRPDAAILIYPATDFSLGRAREILGSESGDPGTVNQVSTWKQVSALTPPVFLWHNLTDELVPHTHSMRFAEMCYEYKVPCELHILGYGAHGFGMKERDPKIAIWREVCANWLCNLDAAEVT